jgi:hypothetical protein
MQKDALDALRLQLEGQIQDKEVMLVPETVRAPLIPTVLLTTCAVAVVAKNQNTQAELEAVRARHAKEVLDLKTVIAERDDRIGETRENALALETDVNTVGSMRD